MGSEAGREEDDVAALRGKLDDTERRLHYTALELRATHCCCKGILKKAVSPHAQLRHTTI